MSPSLLVASEAGERSLWDPTILGVLVVISAIAVFCGSVYLLLSTNMGARLGFLVAAACLTGFMVLLSGLWITTATPLNSPRGRLAAWEPVAVIGDPAESEIETVREIRASGDRIETEEGLAQLQPGVEAALVRPSAEGEEEAEPSEFAEFETSSDLLTGFEGAETFTVGGGTKNLFWHHPLFAVVEFCPVADAEVEPGEAPPPAACDPLADTRFLVMQFDFGSVRQPPWIYFGVSVVLFALSMLGLHWHEKDARARRPARLTPVPTST